MFYFNITIWYISPTYTHVHMLKVLVCPVANTEVNGTNDLQGLQNISMTFSSPVQLLSNVSLSVEMMCLG